MRIRYLLFLSIITCGSQAAPSEETKTPTAAPLRPEPRSAILLPPTRDAMTALGPERNDNVCGIRRNVVPDVITRVVGGSSAETHEFPWQVSLQWRYNWYTYHVCGATVIDQNWVLTAAHCTHQFTAKDLLVVAGDHQLKHKEGTEQTRYVERIVEHMDYNTNTQKNDITLLKLSAPLQLDGLTVSPICLPPPMTNFSGNCLVTGWGKLSEHGVSSDILQKVVVPIISDSKCRDNYRAIGYTGPIAESMMCAGYDDGSKDACQGDSGGPFVCRGLGNRYYLAGVVSWGIGCARPNVPGVYTEVSRFVSWISNVVHGRMDMPPRPANIRVTTFGEAVKLDLPLTTTQEPSE
ncbi:trypsin-1-like [Panulirus ornatus]|uniref:trypsin-1-like n=1 Tax=Panulirus ornatus TaxID=150431 RepID=UPI003A8A8093